MCGDEGQLIVVGKEVCKDYQIGWVGKGVVQDVVKVFFDFGFVGGFVIVQQWQKEQVGQYYDVEDDKD